MESKLNRKDAIAVDDLEYFQVVEDRDSISASYQFSILWNVAAISKGSQENGYIVQEVDFETDMQSCFPDIAPSCYFEAWRVENGVIVREEGDSNASCDDSFSYAPLDNRVFIESLGKKGFANYSARVFWVPYGSELFDVVNRWKVGAAKMAGPLKSVEKLAFCDDVELAQYHVFDRSYRHDFDLTQFEDSLEAFNRYLGDADIDKDANSTRAILMLIDSLDGSGVRCRIFRHLVRNRNDMFDSFEVRKRVNQLSKSDQEVLFSGQAT